MLTVFNRREVCITRDIQQRAQVIAQLEAQGIGYFTKSGTFAGAGRTHGFPNINAQAAYEYRIFVHKNDYERALLALRGRP